MMSTRAPPPAAAISATVTRTMLATSVGGHLGRRGGRRPSPRPVHGSSLPGAAVGPPRRTALRRPRAGAHRSRSSRLLRPRTAGSTVIWPSPRLALAALRAPPLLSPSSPPARPRPFFCGSLAPRAQEEAHDAEHSRRPRPRGRCRLPRPFGQRPARPQHPRAARQRDRLVGAARRPPRSRRRGGRLGARQPHEQLPVLLER